MDSIDVSGTQVFGQSPVQNESSLEELIGSVFVDIPFILGILKIAVTRHPAVLERAKVSWKVRQLNAFL
jgi:hypothetical protein